MIKIHNHLYNTYVDIYMCIYIYFFFFFIMQHVKVCAIPSSAANQGDNPVSVAQGGTATPGTTKQLLPPDRVFKKNKYARSTKSRYYIGCSFIFILSPFVI